jgi:dolichol-phosphate mannosyltransferase
VSVPSEWQVPEYAQEVFSTRLTTYCIGIPVLNEGERLRKQLEVMHSLNLGAEVVVADGGSQDGSVDPAFLRQVDVRALLIKHGGGGLSAQLRMLFAWAIGEGYEGVMTIDGNGKDDPRGLLSVRGKLEEGFDFVQGSRYLPGGEAVNVPLDRTLGLRLIHAPLISLAARFRYTDTTNGLRGWSKRLLLDPRVAPFRDVFDTYNLHYYLSVRAPRLGFRVTEVPARRIYPRGGIPPTKLRGFASRLHILKLLVAAVMGKYNP